MFPTHLIRTPPATWRLDCIVNVNSPSKFLTKYKLLLFLYIFFNTDAL